MYIILCIGFGLMFMYRYTREVIYQVVEVAKSHEVEQKNLILSIIVFWITVLSIILMPLYLLAILFTDRQTLIKNWSRDILVKNYNLELKNNS